MKLKIFKFLAVISLLMAAIACNKDDDFVDPTDWEYKGEVSALKDGHQWKAKVRAAALPEDGPDFSLQFHLYENYLWLEFISIDNIKPITTKQTIYNLKNWENSDSVEGYHGTLIDGDAVDETYLLDESRDNYIIIDRINERKNFIEGRFQLYTTLVEDNTGNDAKPEVAFTNGQFSTEVNPVWFK